MFDIEVFLARVARLREQRGISKHDFDERSDHEFCTALHGDEDDRLSCKVLVANIVIAADILGTSTDYLLGRTVDPRPGLTEDQIQ